MRGRNVLMLVALGLALAGCGGAGKPLRVPVRIVAAFAPTQGGSDPVAEPRASHSDAGCAGGGDPRAGGSQGAPSVALIPR
ncbi:MAG TPA: hypothetical protein EYP85_01485, partial [Armatimonadetes bacterium]|nr:hypothetical protein [Armatimonadota bacterium]